MSKMTIGFAGLTHLGTCSSIAANISGNNVVAFDINKELILLRKNGEFDNGEPGIQEFLCNLPDNYLITDNILDLNKCDVIIISIDSPVDLKGEVDTSPVKNLYDLIINNIDIKIPIVILSQVRPGFTRSVLNSKHETYYQMETLIFGQGLERALKPERYVVGVKDESKPLNSKYEEFLKQSNCPILQMNYESAELTKLSANFFLAATVTATNTLAALSAELGANWKRIAESLRLDKRIGPFAYLNAGLGIGGSNIIRDLIGIKEMSNKAGTDASIVDAMLINSDFSKSWIIRELNQIIQELKSPRIGFLGLSYKQNTTSTVGSSGVKAAKVYSKSFPVHVFDPVVKENIEINDSVIWESNVSDLISKVNVLVISTEWANFKSSELIKALQVSEVKFILDPYNCLADGLSSLRNIEYRTLGV